MGLKKMMVCPVYNLMAITGENYDDDDDDWSAMRRK
jgi:hypothetical protein